MLKQQWKEEQKANSSFGSHPNKHVLTDDYGKLIRQAVFDGLMDGSGNNPYEPLLLFAFSLGTMFDFEGVR